MDIRVRQYSEADTEATVRIQNHTVEEEMAFPQIELLTAEAGEQSSSEQSFIDIACDGAGGDIVGLYTLHSNNVGRCGHICNASYAVKPEPWECHISKTLVRRCMEQEKKLGFRILQSSVTIRGSVSALHVYEKLRFTQLDTMPGGLLMEDGSYEDIIPHYHVLWQVMPYSERILS